jgi:hypothetical protein
VAKTLLLTEFGSHHDRRFFEKRVNTSVFCIQQDKKIGSKSAKNVVIYSILCCEMVRTRVNTTVLVPESG